MATRLHVAGFGFGAVFEVPVDGCPQSVVERRRGREPERVGRATRIDAPSWLTVGLRRVPPDGAVETDDLHDELDELSDRPLLIGAEVHRLGPVVALRSQDDALGRVVDVQELA